MSDAIGTVEQLAGELARVFEPLARQTEDTTFHTLLGWLGLRPSEAVAGASDLAGAIATAAAAATDLQELIGELARTIEQDDAQAVAAASGALLQNFATLVQAAHHAAGVLQVLSASPSLTPQQRAELAAFASVFVERLLNRLFVEYLEVRFPQLALGLLATGGLEIVQEDGAPAGSLNGPYIRKTFHFERMAKLFTDPAGLLREVYQWGEPGFDGLALFTALQTLLREKFEIPAEILQPPGAPAILEAFGFNAEVNPGLDPPGLDVSLRMPASVDRTETIAAGDWQVTFDARAVFAADLAATVRPLLDLQLDLPAGAVDVRFSADLARALTAPPFLLLGEAGGSRLEVRSPNAGAALDLHFDTSTGPVAIDPQLKAGLRGGKLMISAEDGDGFITTLLSGDKLESDFEVELSWSPSRGVRFTGSAALEIAIPAHVALGPLEILSLYLRASLAEGGSIPVELSGGFKAVLGPLTASVDRLGLVAMFTFPKGGGNLGPANLGFAFKPPNGVGLAVDAGVIKGGGYLFFDSEKEEYAGALELVFSDIVNLKAIGLITTKMPDGSKGFSLLIIITAEFGTGIQLGFGFTLLGVGGLLGLNRTVRLQVLIEGVRTGAVNRILFPQDVIANAPRIISDLRAIFPPEEGKFLIGPMAKLSWGTPTLISLSLGIIIEIPGNIAILGVLRVALPADDIAILVLQVNFAGAIEFDKKRVYFFAQLFESRLLFTTIEGEMGVLAAFGADANFVVTVGGFHPQFNPPPLPFPAPRRISFNIANTPTARIRAEGYFAVTPNTRQFGARAELVLGFDDFGIQGHIAFDALFQVLFPFLPLSFNIQISASVSLKAFGVGVFSIRLRFALEGPTPGRARGEGSISLLFFEISADFDETWGETRNTTLPPIAVMPLLKAEFEKVDNWTALPPASSNLLVSLRKIETVPGNLVLHPVGALRVSQKAVPLDLDIDQVGSQKPSDAKRFTLTVISGGLSKTKDKDELFAPAQFENMDDADKLSRPAYQPLHGGIELSVLGQDLASGKAVKRIVRYEEIIIDNNFKRFVRRFFVFFGSLFTHLLKGSAITKSTLSRQYKQQLQPFEAKIKVNPDLYTVAFNHDNKAFGTAAFTSEAMARDFMQQQVALDPNLTESLHVVPHFEINKAA